MQFSDMQSCRNVIKLTCLCLSFKPLVAMTDPHVYLGGGGFGGLCKSLPPGADVQLGRPWNLGG